MTRRSKQVGVGLNWLIRGDTDLSSASFPIWVCNLKKKSSGHKCRRQLTQPWEVWHTQARLRNSWNLTQRCSKYCTAVILEKRAGEGSTPNQRYTTAPLSTLMEGTKVGGTVRRLQRQRSWAHTLIVSLQGWMGEAHPQIPEKGHVQAKNDQQGFS